MERYINLETLDNEIIEAAQTLQERDMEGNPDGNMDDVRKLAKWMIQNGRSLLQNASNGDVHKVRHDLLDVKGAMEEAWKEVEIAAQKAGMPPVGAP